MRHRHLQRLKSDCGATAVEFALLLPLLLYIFMAIIELSLMFFVSVNMDGSANEAARRIRTGQAQTSGDPQSDFSSTLCTKLDSIIDCGALYYDVRPVASYGAVSTAIEYDPDTGEPITYGFNAGGSNSIIVARAMYVWTLQTPGIAMFFESWPGTGKRMISSTVVFQSEPYE